MPRRARSARTRSPSANKKGFFVPVSDPVFKAFSSIPAKSFVIDNEGLGDQAAAFDIVELDGLDLTPLAAIERFAILEALLEKIPGGVPPAIIRVENAVTPEQKRSLASRVEASGGEGLVGKKKDSPYRPGRPASGGDHVKRKFFEEATVIFGEPRDGKRSVEIFLVGKDDSDVSVGNVTIPQNAPIPAKGTFGEVRYLYAYEGGGLHVPTYKAARTDVDRSDCVIGQLKYKGQARAAHKRKHAM